MAVPILFFTLWPVKGYQYLLPIAPALAVLAGRTLSQLYMLVPGVRRPWLGRVAVAGMTAAIVVTLVVPTWNRIEPSSSGTFLAGTGGVPGGREAGLWMRDHLPRGAHALAIGPSMANILQFYSRHRVYGLSVSSDRLARNPVYEPVPNPDWSLRSGALQYLVWDSYTARRTTFYAQKLNDLIDKYHGTAVFTATVAERGPSGDSTVKPVVIVYQVHLKP
jgi:hypothetical protein